jgi:hypothetical protein
MENAEEKKRGRKPGSLVIRCPECYSQMVVSLFGSTCKRCLHRVTQRDVENEMISRANRRREYEQRRAIARKGNGNEDKLDDGE